MHPKERPLSTLEAEMARLAIDIRRQELRKATAEAEAAEAVRDRERIVLATTKHHLDKLELPDLPKFST